MLVRHDSKNRRSRDQSSRQGVAAVEAALLLPVMIILVLGTIEMGIAMRAATVMQSAVREAGRLVNTDWTKLVDEQDDPNAKLERDLRNYVTASGLPGNALTVSVTHAGENDGQPFDLTDPNNELQPVKITLSVPHETISLFPNRYLGGKNIRASLVMRAGVGGNLSN